MLTARAPARRRRVVIVGGGFAGFHAARAFSRLAKGLDVEVVLVSPTDYSLNLPLLPEVAAGIAERWVAPSRRWFGGGLGSPSTVWWAWTMCRGRASAAVVQAVLDERS